MGIVTALATVCGAALAACVGYEIVLMLVSLPSLARRRPHPAPAPRTRFVVVIPAHDESVLIGATVRSVLANAYPEALRELRAGHAERFADGLDPAADRRFEAFRRLPFRKTGVEILACLGRKLGIFHSL